MNKEEILEKSRAENKKKDIYELEVQKQAGRYATVVMASLGFLFFVVQMFVGGGANFGIYALILSGTATTFWVKYGKLRRKYELAMAISYTLLVLAMSAWHIYKLIESSAIL